MKKHLLFIYFILQTLLSIAQQPVSIHLTEKDGLPDIEFYDILEDKKGFIWLAADKGLYRYDGKTYKLFTHPKKRGRSLFGLTLDDKGNVWANNLAGQFFYTENDSLRLFKDFKNIKNLVDFYIYKNHLIIQNFGKVVSVNIDTKEQVAVLENNSILYLKDINTNPNPNGFYLYINDALKFTKDVQFKKTEQLHLSKLSDLKVRGFRNFFRYKNTFYYFFKTEVLANTELFKLGTKDIKKLETPTRISNSFINHIYTIHNKLWVLTNKGVFICSLENNTLKIEKSYFNNLFITDLLVDKNNNYWFTTLKNGVFVMPNLALKKIEIPENLGVTRLEKLNKNELLFATLKHEIFKYSLNTDALEKKKITFRNTIYDIVYNDVTKNLIVSAKLKSVFINKKGDKNISNKLMGTKTISEIDANKYLISQAFSLSIYDKFKDTVKNLREVRSFGSVLNKNKTKAYANFIDGLATIDLETNKYKQILHKNKPIYASKIALSKDNIVWVATENKGVYGFDNDTLRYQFTKATGLVSNLINVIQPDYNTLWLATDKGLQNYNYKTKKISILNKEDGIDSYNINAIEVLANHVFFASNTGLFQFNKAQISKSKNMFKPYFTNIRIQEKDTLLKKTYQLKQTESQIRFGFNTNGFQSNKFVSYEYQLEGFSDNWVKVEQGLNFVKFNTLPAGNFNFKLRAKNVYQNKYTTPIQISLKVLLPFYKTWWFFSFIFLISIVFIWFFFDRKTKQLQAKQKRELEQAKVNQQLVFSQLENLRSQMNPHFIFNALNSIQDYIILNEKKLARVFLVKFSRLIRIYLEHSQKAQISLEEEIKALRLYLELETDRFDDGFEFNINVAKDLELKDILVPSLFIQPYVENAIKHGLLHKKENKRLQLQFFKKAGFLVCTIQDNGVGRAATAEINKELHPKHASFASSANQKRVDLINKTQQHKITLDIVDLYDDKNKPTGTKVIINIKL
ncbi:sensor histidine kinase [uncultured Polaribacter sp.]|uniref:sensor histidine kinase n=1 Tax=uncultured Polaribacter sp. TaxID=174711 RepID=UPI0026224A51|nr:sensor histidine kinase [uncultured Polaribacter sp.]